MARTLPRTQARAEASLNRPIRKKFGNVPTKSTNELRRLSSWFDEVGCLELGKYLYEQADAADELQHAGTTAARQLETTRAELVAQIAAGEIDADTAAVQIEEAERAASCGPIAGQLVNDARHHVIRAAVRHLYDLNDAIVLEHIDPAVQEAAATILERTPAAAPVTTDQDLVNVPPKARDAWVTITHERRRIERAHALAQQLRNRGIVFELPPPYVPGECWRWANVDALATAEIGTGTHPNLRLMAQLANGAQPRAMTAQQVVDTYLKAPA